ncbi:Acetyltransferase (GNAT) domain-containing protein [Thalassobacillus cyri]|uniref:Acetyltransferase (GNAT) domain-containing protein n=1 Tax=Thalassobacillus cyri TaxID=571932 RepID=A0A1H3VKH6_9BACI|nr:GNAT family N-acetyltransferase [Thalassobacillus cyri]SDZ75181.1 Acetyltransferase (GNAT) domain-containing protein [Thalassobacillus cyri]
MNWYEKLKQYFPIEEMKSQEHMETLLKEKGDVYYKDEGPHHVLMYAEFPSFLFIDYVYVSAASRGQGLGHKLMQKMKDKGKPIILEVEPVDYDDTDTEKRLRFYQREGFKHAQSIGYTRKSLATDEPNSMEILYWSPEDASEEHIYEQMKKMYEEIHTYKDTQFYGKSYEPVEEVLTYDEDADNTNILEDLEKEKA